MHKSAFFGEKCEKTTTTEIKTTRLSFYVESCDIQEITCYARGVRYYLWTQNCIYFCNNISTNDFNGMCA